jgi:transposase
VISARYVGAVRCPRCGGGRLRVKDRFVRRLRHESRGLRHCWLHLEAHKYYCRDCHRYFHQRFPGVLPRRRSTERFRHEVFQLHYEGICRRTLATRYRMGTATIERWFHELLERKAAELSGAACPLILGIDEHFFTRRRGYVTTLCDLRNRKVYDVVPGRSEKALAGHFSRLRGREKVQVVCMDMAANYRALVRKYFPQAKIVTDRFHVIRLVNQQFLATWRLIDPLRSKHRGLLRLMRRHHFRLRPEQQQQLARYLEQIPALKAIYEFKQHLCGLLLRKHRTARQCRQLIPQLLRAIRRLKTCGLEPLVTLGKSLYAWRMEIARMWRFTKNNGITEGFHTKMEMIQRRAFGFRNFQNYRLRVRVMCA